MPELTVPEAVLYYEIFDTKGPLLVLIPGRGRVLHPAAEFLAANFTVAYWDRRGYSQSLVVGQQDFESRLQTDADDA
ncbi:hypothetical protein QQZ08_001073 [Neonectria magnoliae]|uniref:Alpha/beta hydrolase n=1 Tax=Neonectria magnoliae TaxID=2732573 RepID=A0ABR1IFV3_9HYPO